jgi:hypothetical protein
LGGSFFGKIEGEVSKYINSIVRSKKMKGKKNECNKTY